MIPAIAVVVLTGIGVGALYGLWRLFKSLEKRADEVDAQSSEPEVVGERPEIGDPLGPDGITYLCAHEFVEGGAPRSPVNARRRAYAPVTGDELEPRRLAEQILHSVFVALVQDECLRLRLEETDPSFMPPFPNKRWCMHAIRARRLTGCPLAEALDCAFDLTEQRVAKRGGDVADGVPLDELVEEMLKVMRQEMSFWEKAGVYADVRQYLEAALIDEGYLIEPPKDTWLEKLKHARPTVNEDALEYLTQASGELAKRVAEFRQKQGSEAARAAEGMPAGRTEDVDDALVDATPPFDGLPLHDCLKMSIYEALMAIRQLEPSEDVGV